VHGNNLISKHDDALFDGVPIFCHVVKAHHNQAHDQSLGLKK
jgi:hypothetical protein